MALPCDTFNFILLAENKDLYKAKHSSSPTFTFKHFIF